ncbi:hypothetical protein [Dokdonia sp. R86516]|uniref:hypothetical protein n=1 Tax=Dokdonia sp. R86516 TaxID=3093856 RepID=UPI0037C7BD98
MKIIFLLLILFSSNILAQKKYAFDRISTYSREIVKPGERKKDKNDSITKLQVIYLTQENDNSYFALLTKKDSLNFTFKLTDRNGVKITMDISRIQFEQLETLEAPCKNISEYVNPYKYQVKNYDFTEIKDTIIEGVSYSSYKLTSNNSKRAKRKKLGTNLYIIDKSTTEHLPFLTFATAYEEWKTVRNIPNGLFIEKHMLFYSGKTFMKEKIISTHKIQKQIIIASPCL